MAAVIVLALLTLIITCLVVTRWPETRAYAALDKQEREQGKPIVGEPRTDVDRDRSGVRRQLRERPTGSTDVEPDAG